MDAMELMRSRHSVRQYLDKEIEEEKRRILDELTRQLNEEGHLHIQMFYEEPECFDSRMAHYGRFENVRNYIAVVGRKSPDLDERSGYCGEKLVLKAQELGLNTCWVALTHGKSKAVLQKDEKEVILIALGYGKNQGVPHRNRDIGKITEGYENAPEWYRRGIEAAMLAPTAVNQQKF
ncbi:MAG: nitroreductase, partial [Erysipelotrichaceae bacterium]|nr:nitroreductase [Erysipelotrichaceae bacterium]